MPQSERRGGSGFTSLKKRDGVKRLICPFRCVSGAVWTCREEGRGQGSAPCGRTTLTLVLLPAHAGEAGNGYGGMWSGGPRAQVVLGRLRLRSSLRGCPRLAA